MFVSFFMLGITTAVLLLAASHPQSRTAPVFANVHIGDHGPYRFLVDTGAQTSLIDEKLAAKLHLEPTFRIEVVTQHSTSKQPAMRVGNLRIGKTALPETELVWHDLAGVRALDPGLQGVLGLNGLSGLKFSLSPSTGGIDFAAERPRSGTVVPFSRVEDRIAVKARMGTETLTLILDSGSTHIVLFRVPEAMARTQPVTSALGTLEGTRSIVPTCWTADLLFGEELRVGTLPAAVVNRPGTEAEGLLPASVFKTVYVDPEKNELVLVR